MPGVWASMGEEGLRRPALLIALVGVVSLLVVDAYRYEADMVAYVRHEEQVTRAIRNNQYNRPNSRLLRAGVTSR